MRAGDDISICHVTTRNYRQASDFGSAPQYVCDTRDPATLDYLPAAPSATVNFVVFVDSAAAFAHPVEDDDGIGDDVPQIFLHTNGDITATELDGDMWVGSIESTNGNVTLTSPRRILDADSRDTIDVGGDNITMTAGTALGLGGIGLPTDFLEINTAPKRRQRVAQGVRHCQRRQLAGHLPR